MTQKYDKTFKIDAVKVYLSSDKSLDTTAQALGVPRSCLGKWVRD
jgi:transposase-like protein